MIQDVVLWTCSGGMKIVYLNQFAKMIPHEIMQSEFCSTARMKNSGPAFWDPRSLAEMPGPQEASFERHDFQLKTFHQITDYDKRVANGRLDGYSRLFREQVQEASFKRIEEEFKVMVAQRNPTFFMKDLSIENVEKLAEEFAKNMGGDACGVNVQLSPYQKFFVIIDPSDMKFYAAQVERHLISQPGPVTEYLGKLVDLRPDKWQMGRYEDLTYMKELSAMRMYQAPGGSK